MSPLDFVVLFGTLLAIAGYGIWRTRGSRDLEGYFRGDHTMKWGTIGLSVMATQASAITFLSTPGLAYEQGMAFVQNYLGLPIALVIVSALFIPMYYRLRVYTAYEYLERRFDLKTRQLGAFLFLIQRGLSAGITIYAPSIIVSTLLGWSLDFTILLVGILAVAYTVSGGTRAVSLTQKYQLAVIWAGMFTAFALIVREVTGRISFPQALALAGKMGRLEVINPSFDFSTRYTLWSGMLGGLFLALSYFGTDQSQVQRYLTGRSVTESRLGLMFNAVVKVPMQFFILFVGVMVFLFYQFEEPPMLFKQSAVRAVQESARAPELQRLETRYSAAFREKRDGVNDLAAALRGDDEEAIAAARDRVRALQAQAEAIRTEAKKLVVAVDPRMEVKDSDYVFLTFILNHLPRGVIGLLIAVIFSAAMSSIASELNALGSTSSVDLYRRLIRPRESERHYVIASRVLTAFWGVAVIAFALFAYMVENLIEAVNILGSLFYGTILGIFLTAFLVKRVGGHAVFLAALLAEGTVIALFFTTDIGYLWYNLIGCGLVLVLGLVLQAALPGGGPVLKNPV
ncbi:MAG TPA: sodium:solute symporter [Candidatus Polarisedimenticolia bacterium]|nr:sodium:solute symporter [Candidatus Polarisedimenticolia bacterium]